MLIIRSLLIIMLFASTGFANMPGLTPDQIQFFAENKNAIYKDPSVAAAISRVTQFARQGGGERLQGRALKEFGLEAKKLQQTIYDILPLYMSGEKRFIVQPKTQKQLRREERRRSINARRAERRAYKPECVIQGVAEPVFEYISPFEGNESQDTSENTPSNVSEKLPSVPETPQSTLPF